MMMRPTPVFVACLVAAICGLLTRPLAAQTTEPVQGATLEELMDIEIASVYGAAKREQRVTEAPASVTVLTADDIAAFGWRTFPEVLNAARGFYVTYDRNYSYLGVRGFGRPTDFNNRVLLLVDGHPLNDNVYDGAWLGTEFPLSVDLIDRVELIRGPGSALYGTSAFFAVLNVVTKRGGGVDGATVNVEVASQNVVRATAIAGTTFGSDREVLLSISHDRSAGNRSLFYPEYAGTQSGGLSVGNDDDRATRVFANLRFGATHVQAGFSQRGKDVPTGSWSAVFNDPRNHTADTRAWVEVARSFAVGKSEFRTRASVDHFDYAGTFVYDAPPDTLRDFSRGAWMSGDVVWTRALGRHRVMAGIEHRNHVRQDQWAYYLGGESAVDVDASSWQAAAYVQDEITVHPKLTATVGARYDHWSLSAAGSSAMPRLGAVYQPLPDTAIKILYGRAFRDPSLYEMFYADSATAPNPTLRPETLQTTELVFEQYLRRRLRVSATAYATRIEDLISQATLADFGVQHQNTDTVNSIGAGIEAELRLTRGAIARAAYTYADVRDDLTQAWLSNSPRHLATLAGAVPWVERRLTTAVEATYTGERLSASGRQLASTWLVNANAVFGLPTSHLQVAVGADNLLDAEYAHPVGLEFAQDAIQQDGRTLSVKAVLRF